MTEVTQNIVTLFVDTQAQGTPEARQTQQFCLFLLFPHHNYKPVWYVRSTSKFSFMETSAS